MARTKRDTTPEHLKTLNEVQRKVAEHDRGAAAMWAVPGSGKTTTVIARIAELVRKGEDPERILATTFTRPAAKEMNDRLKKLGVPIRKVKGDGGARVGTYHSLCLEIIRDGSPWCAYEVDAKDAMRYVLKDIVGWREMDWRGVDLTEVNGFISKCKNALAHPNEARALFGERLPHYNFFVAYERYEDERHRRGLLTFDDMLVGAVDYLRMDLDALHRWQGRFDHVIVDEYQDTNVAQHALMKLLQADSKSFLVVGDDDQLIYEWRGSKPSLSTGFAEEFGAEEFRAESNYRSCPEIVSIANAVIKNNDPDRIEKAGKAERGATGHVSFHRLPDLDEEAEFVCSIVKETMNTEEWARWKDFTILYRTNAQSRAFEEVFLREKVPHVVVGGQDFYSRKEVADILAYLRLAVDPADDDSFRRAINRPFRYIGKAALDSIERVARRTDESMWNACCDFGAYGNVGLQQRQVRSIEDFLDVMSSVKRMIYPKDSTQEPRDLPSVISHVIRVTGYEQWLLGDEGSDTAENSRVTNLKELVRTSGRFDSAGEMIAHVDHLKRMRKGKGKKVNAVKLMTIHKAKGLEWSVVFLAGCSDGFLPHAKSSNEQEERRLFYVGATRAMDALYVTSPSLADAGGSAKVMSISKFAREAGLVSQAGSVGDGEVV